MENIVETLKTLPDYFGSTGRTEKEIDQAERLLGVFFAKDYRRYLKEIGLACFDGREWTGLTKTDRLNVVSVTLEQRELFGKPTLSWYVVEEAHIDGIVIWQSADGTVYQTAPNVEAMKIANSLVEYITK